MFRQHPIGPTGRMSLARSQVITESEDVIVEAGCIGSIRCWMESGIELDEVDPSEVEDLDAETQHAIHRLESVIAKVPPTQSRTRWWRGFGKEADLVLRRTGRWESTRITSLTASEEVAVCFGVAWKVIVPAGERVLYISLLKRISEERLWSNIDAEEEALVGKGTFTRVGTRGTTLVFRGSD